MTTTQVDHLNRPVAIKETELIAQKRPKKKSSGPTGFTWEFYQIRKEE